MANVTIKDVAKQANVSIATVSRVLNKNYFVSPELEKKVMDAIKELDYYPNSVARSLKNESTQTIGLIVSDISNSFFTFVNRSVENVLKKYNYNLIVCSTDNQPEKELSYLKLLLEKKVDGIILNTTGSNREFIASVSHQIPFVLCGRKVMSPNFIGDFVDSDNTTGSYLLTRHMIEQGHKKIGIINGQQSVSSGIERMEGFRRAMESVGITVNEQYPYQYYGDYNCSDSGYEGAKYLFSLENAPTAVLAMNNELAVGALRYLHTHGLQIPEDISFACYGNILNVDLFYVQPHYIDMDPRIIGTKVGELLIERIEHKNELPNREILFAPALIEGNSVKTLSTDS